MSLAKILKIDDVELREISDRVSEELADYSKRTLKRVDITNKVDIGGVHFWTHIERKEGEVDIAYLCYDKHPSKWDVERIKRELDALEISRFARAGIII